MTLVSGRTDGSPVGIAAEAVPGAAATPTAAKSAFTLPTAGVRELRLDMFRGLALWLIFIDHVSPDLLTWFTIRSYGFSDAAEIFIFISGYTAAFVYGRALLEAGFVVATARIVRRVWQIYAMHILLFAALAAEVSYVSVILDKPFYAEETGIKEFLNKPGIAMIEAMLLRYRPLNMDVLPLYIVLMLFLPLVLLMMKWRANLALAASVILYLIALRFDLHLVAYPNGFWSFNPYAWQMLFVFGAWCSLGGTARISRLLSSPVTLWIAFFYLLASFGVTMTWYFPQHLHLPHWLELLIYPINKTDLDILRFAHFLALAVIAIRLVPAGWPGLRSPWLRPLILCGQHSLEIFALGVALAFTGYYILMETSAGLALHILVGICGIGLMCAMAWLLSWYKSPAKKGGKPSKAA